MVLLDFGARSRRAEFPHSDELLALQTPAVQGPNIQHFDVHAVALCGRVPRRGLHLTLDHHGGFVSLVLDGIQTRGVAGERDPDEQHGEVDWIKPHAACFGSVVAGGAAAGRCGLRGDGGGETASGLQWHGSAADLA